MHYALLPASPKYQPYLKPADSPNPATSSFRPNQSSSSLCVHCGNKGHRAFDCLEKQASRPERYIIVVITLNLWMAKPSASSSMPGAPAPQSPLTTTVPTLAPWVAMVAIGPKTVLVTDLDKSCIYTPLPTTLQPGVMPSIVVILPHPSQIWFMTSPMAHLSETPPC